MSAVTVSHVPKSVDLYKLQEFFSFCSNVSSINEISTDAQGFKTYQVNFTSEKAIETALLLDDAELDSVSVKVTKSTLPTYQEAAKSGEHIGDNKIQYAKETAVITGEDSYDDISQEEKPKSAILAQLLASGYKLSDDLIGKAINVDKEKGISSKFTSFLSGLDKKFLHTQDPESSTAKGINKAQGQLSSLADSVQKSSYSKKLQHYFNRAAASPYGEKVHDFYKSVSQEVADVHKEATRLYEIKKASEAKEAEGNVAPIASGEKTA